MRCLMTLLLALALAAPALAQTPPPETITFEGVGTPMTYEPGADVPDSARLKSLELVGGGTLRFRTRRGAKYVALVTHLGTTAIAGVSRKGKLTEVRFVEMRLRKAPGARIDSFVPVPAGARLVDDKDTTNTDDDEFAFDEDGEGLFLLYDARKRVFPPNGSQLPVLRQGAHPNGLVKVPYDLTTTSFDFTRILIFGTLVYDDLVVSYGH